MAVSDASFDYLFQIDGYADGLYQEETLSLFFLFSGELQLTCGGVSVMLKPGDLFCIEPFTFFGLHTHREDVHFLLMRFPLDYLRRAERAFGNRQICCASCGPYKRHCTDIKRSLAEIFALYQQDLLGSELLIRSYLYRLLFQIYSRYAGPVRPGGVDEKDRSLELIRRISQYISDHATEKLTLRDVAQHVHLTPNYLSHFFRTHMSTTFSDYLTQIRLHTAVSEMLHTSNSIVNVAINAGFANINSFYRAFRRAFGLTPTEFRKSRPLEPVSSHSSYNWESVLLQYRKSISSAEIPTTTKPKSLLIEIPDEGQQISHNWQQIINVGYAADLLNARVQDQLRTLQSEIGFTHLRFHGILNDALHIYNEDSNGQPILNFAFLDMLLDFLTSIGLFPYLEFSFIPTLLAQEQRSPFSNQACISYVTSLEKWEALIYGIVAHCVERYGRVQVRQWYFSFIGFNWIKTASDTPFMTEDEYYRLYFSVYRAVKHVDSKFRIGGPAIDLHLLDCIGYEILIQWIKTCEQSDCPPDFLAVHCYPYRGQLLPRPDHINQALSSDEIDEEALLTKDPNYMFRSIDKMTRLLCKAGVSNLPIIIDEWDSSLHQRNPMNDTCYRSAYLVKNILHTFRHVSCLAQASLSDFSEETTPKYSTLYGGSGIFTHNGLKKSSYYAYWLLASLGNEFLMSGENWALFRKDHCLQLILHHSCQYVLQPNINGDLYQAAFGNQPPLRFTLELRGLTSERYFVRSWRIGCCAGSIYDKWKEMGSPLNLTSSELEYLDNITRPIYTRVFMSQDDLTQLLLELAPNDIIFLELDPQGQL